MLTLFAVVPVDHCLENLSSNLAVRSYSKEVQIDATSGLTLAQYTFSGLSSGDIEPTKNIFKEAYRTSSNRKYCQFGVKKD